MLEVSSQSRLPTAEQLPDSDDTPVDNELQNLIPNLLLSLLQQIWAERDDWFFGVDMGIYYEPNIEEPAKSKVIVPDGFLALGVPRFTTENGRLSYVLWHEKVLPTLVLETVSHKYNGEYDHKFEDYSTLGILYYVIYNHLSGRRGLYKNHQALEVYKLVNGKYELMPTFSPLLGDSRIVWLPEIELGIGCEQTLHGGWQREWLYWYDRFGVRYPTTEEKFVREQQKTSQERQRTDQERQKTEQERQKKEKLAAHLRSLGVDPDQI
jgi:Uma2 family endonuclease